jgi:transposase
LTEAFFDHFGLHDIIKGLKTKGIDAGKLAEALVAYKLGDNFSVLRCHEFIMRDPVRKHMGLPEFDVKTLYRAVEALGENRETVIRHFRKTFMRMYGPELTDTVFDWTSLVYFGSRPELAARGYSRDGHPEECQVMVGVSQLAKPVGVPIGMTVMPGNTHDGNHMLHTYEQVRRDLKEGSKMIFDAGASQKDVLDTIVGDGKHFLTKKELNKSDDIIFAEFSEDKWECLDKEKGEYCLKRKFPSRVNYYFFSLEIRDLEFIGIEKRVQKKLKEARDLQNDIEKGKKLKKKYQISNVLIKATISLQTKLAEITDDEALDLLRKDAVTGREGFFCLVSDADMGAREAHSLYRDKDVIEKLFSSMKTDIGIRPIRTWTENGVYGVLLIGFLAQAVISVTRFFSKPVSSTATKFVADSMQKLTLTVERGADGRERRILSNFNPLNIAVLRSYGLISEA